ncbi:MAG TPA: hypothetical protein VMJ10_05535, partial [Kofleriaceae bacterium]|nr:hypothetical protein [Kofleriaceae bacterium]
MWQAPMTIATWMWPVLAREQDWGVALDRLGAELRAGPPSPRAALDLAAACEYVLPDRKRAIAVYALTRGAGAGRARELAVEIGW